MRNNGNILVPALIAMGMVTGLALMMGKLSNTILVAKTRSDASMSFIDYERSFVAGVAEVINTLANSSCNGGSTSAFNTAFTLTFPGAGTAMLDKTKMAALLSNPKIGGAADTGFRAAMERCSLQNTYPVVPGSTSAQAGYSTCLVFTKDPTAQVSKGFFDSDAAFAEVRVTLVNTASPLTTYIGPFLSCNDYVTSGGLSTPTGGMSIFYKIYWHRADTPSSFFTYTGESLVSQY